MERLNIQQGARVEILLVEGKSITIFHLSQLVYDLKTMLSGIKEWNIHEKVPEKFMDYLIFENICGLIHICAVV